MKALICEMCNSTDLLKQDGVFVCQHCGCKYSVEDAKRMMIDGSVDVSGSSVKVDNSDFVQKYLDNARRSKNKSDWEEVEKYYNLVEQNEPQNIEAIFYSSYAKARQSLIIEDFYKKKSIFEVFCKSISVIDDYYNPAQREMLKPLIENMAQDLIKLYTAEFVYKQQSNVRVNGVSLPERSAVISLQNEAQMQFVESLENINKKDEQAYLYHILINFYERVLRFPITSFACTVGTYNELMADYRNRFALANARLKELEPTYELKVLPEEKKGCYVATAVYGSYDCPEVWTLRRFRDDILAETWYGRAFIRTYYAISPTLVKWFGHTEWFKKMWKGKLDRMVAELNADGVEDTPYEDKVW